jgi:hypothetical protein
MPSSVAAAAILVSAIAPFRFELSIEQTFP